MSIEYKTGEQVSWEWGSGKAYGQIKETYTDKVSKDIKGSTITRNASDEEPAYLIVQDDGDQVLKSQSELQHV